MVENGSTTDDVAQISQGCQRQRRATGWSYSLRTSMCLQLICPRWPFYIQMIHQKSIDTWPVAQTSSSFQIQSLYPTSVKIAICYISFVWWLQDFLKGRTKYEMLSTTSGSKVSTSQRLPSYSSLTAASLVVSLGNWQDQHMIAKWTRDKDTWWQCGGCNGKET